MHIITGLIISALLGSKRNEPSDTAPIGFRNILEVGHSAPGRLRLYAHKLQGNGTGARDLQRELDKADEIESVEASTITGSILVRFDKDRIEAQIVLGAVAQILGLDADVEEVPESTLATALREGVKSLNRGVYEMSGRLVDFSTLVPLTLLGIGLYTLGQPGGRKHPGAFTLLWWAYLQLFAGTRM